MKIFKRILAIVLAASAAFCFSSCLALDRAKERQMFFGEKVRVRSEGNDNYADRDIIFKDKTYKRVAPYGFYETRYFRFDFTYRDEYRVTEPDVPVLLAKQYGSIAEYDPALDLIWCGDSFYCTEENYEEYSRLLKTPDLSCVAIADFSNPNGDRAEFRLLSEDTAKKILSYVRAPEIKVTEADGKLSADAVVIVDADGTADGALVGEGVVVVSDDVRNAVLLGGVAVMQLYITTPDMTIFDIRDLIVHEYNGKYYLRFENSDKIFELPDDVVEELKSYPDSWYTYNDYGIYDDIEEYDGFSIEIP